MGKGNNTKQTREQIRIEISKQFKSRIQALDKDNEALAISNIKLRDLNSKLEQEVEVLKQEVDSLQKKLNITPEEWAAIKVSAKLISKLKI